MILRLEMILSVVFYEKKTFFYEKNFKPKKNIIMFFAMEFFFTTLRKNI